jgi:hypothetical protein
VLSGVRLLEGVVGKPVRVQIPPSAPHSRRKCAPWGTPQRTTWGAHRNNERDFGFPPKSLFPFYLPEWLICGSAEYLCQKVSLPS